MKLTDFHVHPYLNRRQYTNQYDFLHEESEKSAVEKIRSDMKRAGIGHICGSVIEGEHGKWTGDFCCLKNLNRAALELRDLMGEFYTPGFHIHPAFIRESIEEIEFMAERGVKLIGELVPYAHGGYEYAHPGFDEILEAAEAHHMVVSCHSYDEDDMDHMVLRHPRLTFVAAHPGEKRRMERHLERMKRCGNLYLDLSGTGLARLGILAHGVREVGAERFLFGTDYPINNPAMYVQGILYEALSGQERAMICYRNAERILGCRVYEGEETADE